MVFLKRVYLEPDDIALNYAGREVFYLLEDSKINYEALFSNTDKIFLW